MKEKIKKNKSPPPPHNTHNTPHAPKAQKGPVRPSKAHHLQHLQYYETMHHDRRSRDSIRHRDQRHFCRPRLCLHLPTRHLPRHHTHHLQRAAAQLWLLFRRVRGCRHEGQYLPIKKEGTLSPLCSHSAHTQQSQVHQ